jgi:precorrin-6Y C5,15-methyltransferase (decarboxylating)
LARATDPGDLIGVVTSPANGPARIARLLLAEGLETAFEIRVAERLMQPGERLTEGLSAKEPASFSATDPNLLLRRRRVPSAAFPAFGLPDQAYSQRAPDRGLITKREARAAALALLELGPKDLVWDIGAGSGSVGLEAARLCPRGHVYAIEKNPEDLQPMTRDPEALALAWGAAAAQVVEHLQAGTDVVFLVEGDASSYSSFGHLARAVRSLDPGIAVEVIPGVTSFNAAAAATGEALADGEEALAVYSAPQAR